jgi:hypothetical protein
VCHVLKRESLFEDCHAACGHRKTTILWSHLDFYEFNEKETANTLSLSQPYKRILFSERNNLQHSLRYSYLTLLFCANSALITSHVAHETIWREIIRSMMRLLSWAPASNCLGRFLKKSKSEQEAEMDDSAQESPFLEVPTVNIWLEHWTITYTRGTLQFSV